MSTPAVADETSSTLLYGDPPEARTRPGGSEETRVDDYEPVPMETFFVLVCHYCGQQVKDEGILPGHTHHGERDRHGHEEGVFIPATSVEVVRRSDRLARERELLARLKAAEAELERMRRWFPGSPEARPV